MAREPGAEPRGLSPNPRRHALEVISQALSPTGKAFARELLAERFSRAPMKPEDRRLTADLAYGVIRPAGDARRGARGVLGAAAGRTRPGRPAGAAAGRLPDALPRARPAARDRGRIGPAGPRDGKSRATGFVNAVLRSIGRDLRFAAEPDPAQPQHSFEVRPGRACVLGRKVLPPPADSAAHLAAALSFPLGADAALAGALRHVARARALPPRRTSRRRSSSGRTRCGLRRSSSSRGSAPSGMEARPSPTGRTLLLPPRNAGRRGCAPSAKGSSRCRTIPAPRSRRSSVRSRARTSSTSAPRRAARRATWPS